MFRLERKKKEQEKVMKNREESKRKENLKEQFTVSSKILDERLAHIRSAIIDDDDEEEDIEVTVLDVGMDTVKVCHCINELIINL